MASARPAQLAKPALWEISDPDTTIYLFGTIHLLPEQLRWRTPAFDNAVAQSQQLVVETIVDQQNPQSIAAAEMSLGFKRGLPPIAERVPPAKLPKLRAAILDDAVHRFNHRANDCKRANCPFAATKRLRPDDRPVECCETDERARLRKRSADRREVTMAKGNKTAKKAGKGSSKEILIVGSKMKDVVKAAGCMSSGDLIEALSAKVHEMLSSATERAKGNGRSTVRPYDL